MGETDVRVATARHAALLSRLGAVAGLEGEVPVNDGGSLAWGTAWVLRSHALMFEKTGDPAHLHRLAHTVELVLDQRDSVRGVRDFRGVSAPVWSSTGGFTVATARIPRKGEDPDAEAALCVHVCPPGSVGARVEVRSGSQSGTVTLAVTNGDRETDVLADLSLDPAHPRWAPRAAYGAYPGATRTTVTVPGDPSRMRGDSDAAMVREGRYACRPARVSLAAQTGMLAFPVVELARLVLAHPTAAGQRLTRRVDAWLEAATVALATHDGEYRSADGLGWYAWPREQPVSFAGVELPTNEFLAVGRAHLELGRVSADGPHRERAAAIAATLRGQLRPVGRLVEWSYWPDFGAVHRGWSKGSDPTAGVSPHRPQFTAQPKLEDVTHALLDLEFAVACARGERFGSAITGRELAALGETYLRRVARPSGRVPWRRGPWRRVPAATIARDVSRRGRRAAPDQQRHAAAWLALAPWVPAVREHALAVLAAHEATVVGDRGVDAYCAALAARWG
ncbi:hypothetical protein BCF74_12148 [Knoellia remsis]|uniref:Uncharacterized protein n=1 Tax=Knoellia remsis TaxID=407159 RepID=A0A2T0UD55_9MICO|nr:hypothetical protein [Knoellia remsis]PRY55871.1 hypothetical protein BCF74_12148 [Knoellia remsis]